MLSYSFLEVDHKPVEVGKLVSRVRADFHEEFVIEGFSFSDVGFSLSSLNVADGEAIVKQRAGVEPTVFA